MTLFVLLACASAPDPTPPVTPAAPPAVQAPTFAAPEAPTGAPDELPELHGKTDAEILAHLGPPASNEAFTMGACCSEYDIELYNTYPPGQGHEAVPIERWTWLYDGYVVALWFHKVEGTWTVLDTLRYGEGTEF